MSPWLDRPDAIPKSRRRWSRAVYLLDLLRAADGTTGRDGSDHRPEKISATIQLPSAIGRAVERLLPLRTPIGARRKSPRAADWTEQGIGVGEVFHTLFHQGLGWPCIPYPSIAEMSLAVWCARFVLGAVFGLLTHTYLLFWTNFTYLPF